MCPVLFTEPALHAAPGMLTKQQAGLFALRPTGAVWHHPHFEVSLSP